MYRILIFSLDLNRNLLCLRWRDVNKVEALKICQEWKMGVRKVWCSRLMSKSCEIAPTVWFPQRASDEAFSQSMPMPVAGFCDSWFNGSACFSNFPDALIWCSSVIFGAGIGETMLVMDFGRFVHRPCPPQPPRMESTENRRNMP